MTFVPDPALGAGWFKSSCGRFRVARHLSDEGLIYVVWLWVWNDLPEMIARTTDRARVSTVCERYASSGAAP